jgi:predicted HicB family RNase H-like nuclease
MSETAKVDGRSLRATGRTHQFATRIKEETHRRMRILAAEDGITLGELIERAVAAYERDRKAQ